MLASKPAWSVISLRHLLEAVRASGRQEALFKAQLDERHQQKIDLATAASIAAAEQAWNDRHRNAWENT
jgi:hypothetical protein